MTSSNDPWNPSDDLAHPKSKKGTTPGEQGWPTPTGKANFMPSLTIRTYPDPVLKGECAPVETITDEVRRLLDDMAETMYLNNGIGLAAPQVGESVRLIVVDVQRGEEGDTLLKLVNPRIVEKQGETTSEEGCLSCPDLLIEVNRFETVTVEALSPDGKETTIEAEGLLAICLQHEIDHLDGVLLVDRLSSLRRTLYHKKRVKEDAKPPGTGDESRRTNTPL
jgi:peptide deformylase